jgi:hypothetical protein
MENVMIGVLIGLLILFIVAGVIWYIITLLPLPHPFGLIAQLVLLLIIVLIALSYLLPLAGIGLRGHPLGW